MEALDLKICYLYCQGDFHSGLLSKTNPKSEKQTAFWILRMLQMCQSGCETSAALWVSLLSVAVYLVVRFWIKIESLYWWQTFP